MCQCGGGERASFARGKKNERLMLNISWLIALSSCLIGERERERDLGRACRAGAQAAEARPVLLLHCTAELLSSRCTSDAGHHPSLQAGESAQQLALPGLHHWCTAVL